MTRAASPRPRAPPPPPPGEGAPRRSRRGGAAACYHHAASVLLLHSSCSALTIDEDDELLLRADEDRRRRRRGRADLGGPLPPSPPPRYWGQWHFGGNFSEHQGQFGNQKPGVQAEPGGYDFWLPRTETASDSAFLGRSCPESISARPLAGLRQKRLAEPR